MGFAVGKEGERYADVPFFPFGLLGGWGGGEAVGVCAELLCVCI